MKEQPEPTLCKKHGMVNNPRHPHWGGGDCDVEWLTKCDCLEGECKNE